MEQLIAKIEVITYPKKWNSDKEFAILKVKPKGKKQKIAVKGFMMPCKKHESFVFHGKWVHDAKYGKQFQFDFVERCQDGELAHQSLLLHCFGTSLSRTLEEQYGDAETAWNVFCTDANELMKLKGFGSGKISKALGKKQELESQNEKAELFRLLSPYGVSVAMMEKLLAFFHGKGVSAIRTLKENPFSLLRQSGGMEGVGFHTCDRIASAFGIGSNHPYRMEASILHLLHQSQQSGHVCMPKEDLLEQAIQFLTDGKSSVTKNHLVASMFGLLSSGELMETELHGERFVYMKHLYKQEKELATAIQQLVNQRVSAVQLPSDMKPLIQAFEVESKINLEPMQFEAIQTALSSPITVITGGAGTGKTTVLKGILHVLRRYTTASIVLCSPTGKAAKRMREVTGENAYTIHRLLYGKNPIHEGFFYTKKNPLPYDVVIVDEVSMMDSYVSASLMSAIRPNAKVILVGDKQQLPSVGAGQVLADIISSERVPVVALKKVHRYGGELLKRAEQVANGEEPEVTNVEGWTFLETNGMSTDSVYKLVEHTYQSARMTYGKDDVTVLIPQHRGEVGREVFNKILQESVNPSSPLKTEIRRHGQQTVFRSGDKIIQQKNNHTEGLANGEIGSIFSIDTNVKKPIITADYEGESKEYEKERFDEIDLAYCLTVHRSQGSEWKCVILPVFSEHQFMLRRRLLYTAMTRSKTQLILIGSKDAFLKGVSNSLETERYSLLSERLQGMV